MVFLRDQILFNIVLFADTTLSNHSIKSSKYSSDSSVGNVNKSNTGNAGTESTLSPPTDKTIKSRLKPTLSPKKNSNMPEDKEKLVDVMPKSPRIANSRSPRRGGWL